MRGPSAGSYTRLSMPDPGASPPPGHDVASALEGRLGAAATRKWLDREGRHYELIEHEPTFRARDEALASGTEPEHTAKALVLRGAGGLLLAVIPASGRLHLRKLQAALDDHSLRMASEAEIERAFPIFEVGSLPPLGSLLGVPVVVDERLAHHRAWCAAPATTGTRSRWPRRS